MPEMQLLQLRMLSPAVVRLDGMSLVTPSPSGPSDNEGKFGARFEHQTCEQRTDLGNADYAGCNLAQAARAAGLLSFALLPLLCRSWAESLVKAAAAMHSVM